MPVSYTHLDNEKSVSEYKAGKTQAMGYIMGQAMRALKGKAPAQEVQKILKDIHKAKPAMDMASPRTRVGYISERSTNTTAHIDTAQQNT